MSESFDILVIDDDQSFAIDIKAYFESKGINVAIVWDPTVSSALDFTRFKLVLLDLNMPVRSGQEILAQIPEARRPVVIIVSGHRVRTRSRVIART